MWANIKAKANEFTEKIKATKLPKVTKPDFSGISTKAKATLGGFAKKIEPKHLVYFALIILPAIVGLGAYYGIMDSKVKLETANLPENQLARMGVSFTVEEFVKYAGRGERDITALFIEAGISPDSYRQNDGFTPLHAAAAYGRASVVRQLLDKGADVNARDKEGQTALMKAVWNNHADVVSALLQKGANITTNDIKGNNAVKMAKTKSDRRVLDVLVKAGISELKESLDKVAPALKKTDMLPNGNEAKPQVAKTVSASTQAVANRMSVAATQPPGGYTLATGYAGEIGVGKSTDNLYKQFGTQAVTQGEEFLAGCTYPVLRAYDKDAGLPSLTVFFAQSKQGQDKIITAIRVFDDRYKTANGIGVGATLGELRRAGNISSIQYTDSLYAIARDNKMRYELDISTDNMPVTWLNGGDTNSLPDNMKVRSIFIF